jgi:hypothetical protein
MMAKPINFRFERFAGGTHIYRLRNFGEDLR